MNSRSGTVQLLGALLVCAASLGGCGDDDAERSTTRGAASPPPVVEATPPPTVEEPPPSNTRDIHGLEVTVNDDGRIGLRGTDRWGDSIDTEYQSIEFFANAVPVLERSVTPDQATGLRALRDELAPPAPTPAPAEPDPSTPTP